MTPLVLVMLFQVATSAPQTGTPPPPGPQPIAPVEAMAAPDRQSDDIVVADLRDMDAPGSAVTSRTLGSGRTGNGARASMAVFDLSQRFAKCALATTSPGKLALLRDAIDGRINSARQRSAQGRLVQISSACAQDPQIARDFGIATVSGQYDTSYYDRGALVIEALRRFVPDLSLTAAQTADLAVQRRFDAREITLAQFRLPTDRRYFEIAVCLVRLQPELSLTLATTSSSPDTIARLEAAVVNRARICVGNAREVYFDPSQFRFYIADAVYRWAVAARNVQSLLPAASGK